VALFLFDGVPEPVEALGLGSRPGTIRLRWATGHYDAPLHQVKPADEDAREMLAALDAARRLWAGR